MLDGAKNKSCQGRFHAPLIILFPKWFIVPLLAVQMGIIIGKIYGILFFPSTRDWIKFCRRADKKFAIEATKAKAGKPNNLRICSAIL